MTTRLSPEALPGPPAGRRRALSPPWPAAPTSTPPCPTCPGWTLRDLVGHCAEVYAHKRLVLRLGRAPSEDERADAPAGDAVLDYHDEQLAGLLAELEAARAGRRGLDLVPGRGHEPASGSGGWRRRP